MKHSLFDAKNILRVVVALVLLLFAYSQCKLLILETQEPLGYSWRDIDQDYLMLKAFHDDRSIYAPIPKLVKRYLPELNGSFLKNPSPHPPTLFLWFLPMSNLDVNEFSDCWLSISLLALFGISTLLIKNFVNTSDTAEGDPSWRIVSKDWFNIILIFCVLLYLLPVRDNLFWGQFGLVTLFILLLAYSQIRLGRDLLGGVFLACALSIKYVCWPVLLYFVLRKRVKIVIGIAATFLLLNLISLSLLGIDDFHRFFFKAVPKTVNMWQFYPNNLSISRFIGSFIYGRGVLEIPPYYHPNIAALPKDPSVIVYAIDTLIYFSFIFFVFRKSLRAEETTKIAFLRLLVIIPIASPVGWIHYAVSLIPAAFHLFAELMQKTLRQNKKVFSNTCLLFLLLSPIFNPYTYYLIAGLVFRVPRETSQWDVTFDTLLFMSLPSIVIASFALFFEPASVNLENEES